MSVFFSSSSCLRISPGLPFRFLLLNCFFSSFCFSPKLFLRLSLCKEKSAGISILPSKKPSKSSLKPNVNRPLAWLFTRLMPSIVLPLFSNKLSSTTKQRVRFSSICASFFTIRVNWRAKLKSIFRQSIRGSFSVR